MVNSVVHKLTTKALSHSDTTFPLQLSRPWDIEKKRKVIAGRKKSHHTKRPEISRNASAHREVESAIILTLYPISRKYSAIVIPGYKIKKMHIIILWIQKTSVDSF